MPGKHKTIFLGNESVPWFGFVMWNNGATVNPGDVVCFWNNTAGGNHDKMWFQKVDSAATAPGYATNAFSTNSLFKVAGVVYGGTIENNSSGVVVWGGLIDTRQSFIPSTRPTRLLYLSATGAGKAVAESTTSTTNLDGRYFGQATAGGNGSSGAGGAVDEAIVFPWRC